MLLPDASLEVQSLMPVQLMSYEEICAPSIQQGMDKDSQISTSMFKLDLFHSEFCIRMMLLYQEEAASRKVLQWVILRAVLCCKRH